MTTDNNFDIHQRILVVGLGSTGVSCAHFLVSKGASQVAVTDTRDNPPGLEALNTCCPDVAVYTGGFNADAFNAADVLLVSPGVSLREPLIQGCIERGIPVWGDIELFARFTHAPTVAITGTNGKSTVTTLVGEMARRAGKKVQVGGNLGTPALDLLLAKPAELYVLELSSFQLETTTSLNAVAATVLNITPDHMDRYADVDEYVSAKARVFNGDGVMVINADDPLVVELIRPGRKLIRFSLEHPVANEDFGLCDHDGQFWLCQGEERLIQEQQLLIAGRHNTANALASLALGYATGLPIPAMLETLQEFAGLPHRCQFVAEKDGVAWYNDSKGTNVGATQASLQGMPGMIVLIAGGDGKGADFSALADAVRGKVRCAVLIGRDAPLIAAAIGDAAPVVNAVDMDDAVRQAQLAAMPGDRVLLSPACASFDMYRNYAHRGEDFVRAVREALA